MTHYRRFNAACRDCDTETLSTDPGATTEYYMVRTEVWLAAGAPQRGYLCIGCLEKRLGRQLHRGDFTTAKLNDLNYYRPTKAWWHRSKRLIDRLSTPAPYEGQQLELWEVA